MRHNLTLPQHSNLWTTIPRYYTHGLRGPIYPLAVHTWARGLLVPPRLRCHPTIYPHLQTTSRGHSPRLLRTAFLVGFDVAALIWYHRALLGTLPAAVTLHGRSTYTVWNILPPPRDVRASTPHTSLTVTTPLHYLYILDCKTPRLCYGDLTIFVALVMHLPTFARLIHFLHSLLTVVHFIYILFIPTLYLFIALPTFTLHSTFYWLPLDYVTLVTTYTPTVVTPLNLDHYYCC